MTKMFDFRTNREKRQGWWLEERATIPCILPMDGLIAVFRRRDIEAFMDQTYPHAIVGNGNKVWYFHEGRDREIAEVDGAEDRIICNPQVLTQHFMKPRQSTSDSPKSAARAQS